MLDEKMSKEHPSHGPRRDPLSPTQAVPGVDAGLVAAFLALSPEQRLQAHQNALCAILELRHGYQRQKFKPPTDRRPTAG